MNLPELLAPAGNMDRLKAAFRYGADACYLGITRMSLRNFADNFTIENLKEAVNIAHDGGKRIYVACNAFAKDRDMDTLADLIADIENAGADAVIVNDAGVFAVARDTVKRMELHMSTQANVLNSAACRFWHEQGASRIILARELSFEEIRTIRQNTPESLELEVFVHGAMCISYSGRCLLSNYIAGRDSNRGECAQPCRWTYELRERGKDGEYLQIDQDDRGTYILNSRDMNLLEEIPLLCNSGVSSLKIEGRMKSVAYVSAVVNAYRMALDSYKRCVENGEEYTTDPRLVQELLNTSHRPFTKGFFFGNPQGAGQETHSAAYVQDATIAAVVLDYDEERKLAHIEQRNRFFDGDTLHILAPGDIDRSFTVTSITDEEGNPREGAPHPKERLYIGCDEPVHEGDILRLRLS